MCHLSFRKQGGGQWVPCSGNAEQKGSAEGPLSPSHFLGSVASLGAVPCNEAASWLAPRSLSGQHMYNWLVFSRGSFSESVG